MTDTLNRLTSALRIALLAIAATLLLTACGQGNETQSSDDMADAARETTLPAAAPDTAADMAADEVPTMDNAALAAARRERVEVLAASWPADPVYQYAFDALDPSLSITAEATSTFFDPEDDYWGLPRTPGYEAVDLNCTACHSLRIVMQQHATRERWDHLLTWMVEEQGMYPMPDEERALVLAYLVEHFGAESEAAEE